MSSNTYYYFFSTLAQVWSAMLAFTAIAIRDNINKKKDSTMNMAEYITKNLLTQTEDALSISSIHGFFHFEGNAIADSEKSLEDFLKGKHYRKLAQPLKNQTTAHPFNLLIEKAKIFIKERESVRSLQKKLRSYVIASLIMILHLILCLSTSDWVIEHSTLMAFLIVVTVLYSVFLLWLIYDAFSEKEAAS